MCENTESVKKSPTGQYTGQEVVTTLTRCRVGDIYCMASRRSTTTSTKLLTDKLLTDKPDHRQALKTNRQARSMFPTLANRTD